MSDSAVEGKLGSNVGAAAPVATGVPVEAGAPSVSAGVLAAGMGRLKDYSLQIYGQRKPWREVFDVTSFQRPATLSEATGRVRRNLAYFRVNYLVCMVLTTAVVMVMNPSSLIVLASLAAAWLYVFVFRTAPIMWGDRVLSDREKLLAMGGASAIVVFFLTSVASVLFSAIGAGLAVIAVHGSLRVPDDLFLDESEPGQGFMGIFTQPSSTAVAV
mmetsp:Transcript_1784/g.5190  ORF Transcript_1784/g.5190 Transcript_1784/m.5190 type:complete len:215 (+) Transcript_1784:128-772(+)|eukprot:CAMPEP_0117657686 /NCGR_PEP_ID=MMETSP0804-20121206/5462_1 /TAXON_ID=1074897 /ORGANISM="Tetraselmis astigmatica, Strain CCMP880" /LENGTH=214 /DNA_ID=CAMNT_0005464155 /DNA_START=117 /DNA_END=761 /DNA_ORIENTATION=+